MGLGFVGCRPFQWLPCLLNLPGLQLLHSSQSKHGSFSPASFWPRLFIENSAEFLFLPPSHNWVWETLCVCGGGTVSSDSITDLPCKVTCHACLANIPVLCHSLFNVSKRVWGPLRVGQGLEERQTNYFQLLMLGKRFSEVYVWKLKVLQTECGGLYVCDRNWKREKTTISSCWCYLAESYQWSTSENKRYFNHTHSEEIDKKMWLFCLHLLYNLSR